MNGLPNGHVEEEKPSSSSGGMYKVNRPYRLAGIEVPKVMYQVSPINSPINEEAVSGSKHDILAGSKSRGTLTDEKPVKTVSSTTMTSPLAIQSTDAMNHLEERQKKIINQLKSLQEIITNMHQHSLSEKISNPTIGTSTTALNDPKKTSSVGGSTMQKQGKGNWTLETIDVVIHANPAKPPFSLIFFVNLFEHNYANAVVSIKSHIHSSYKGTINLDAVSIFSHEKDGANFKLSLVWKNVEDCTMVVSPIENTNIDGEANIARFLSRLLPIKPDSLNYDCLNWELLVKVDHLLELSSENNNVLSIVEKELASSKNNFVSGIPTIADLVLYSAVANKVMNMSGPKKIPTSVKNWFKHQEIMYDFGLDKAEKEKKININTD